MLVTRTPTPTAPAAPPRPHPPRTGRLGSRICSRPSPRQRQSSPLQRQQPPPHLDLLHMLLHMSVCARVSCSRVHGHGRRSSFLWGLRLASGARSRSSGEWGVGQPCRWGRKTESQVKSIHKQQTTIRKPIECAPEVRCGGRESMEMAEAGRGTGAIMRRLTVV